VIDSDSIKYIPATYCSFVECDHANENDPYNYRKVQHWLCCDRYIINHGEKLELKLWCSLSGLFVIIGTL